MIGGARKCVKLPFESSVGVVTRQGVSGDLQSPSFQRTLESSGLVIRGLEALDPSVRWDDGFGRTA